LPVGARLFTGVLLSALLSTGLFLVPFPTGWEGGIAIVGLTAVDQPNIIYTSNCKGYSSLTEEILIASLTECGTGGNKWTVDIDSKNSGRPTLVIETQQPRHTDAGNNPTDSNIAAASIEVTRGRDTFFIDRHVFMFEFQVKTVADSVISHCFYVEGCSFDHETSAYVPNFTTDPLRGTVEISRNGAAFNGASLVLFSINPWSGARIYPENTVHFDQWVGIMQATIYKATPSAGKEDCLSCSEGKVPNAPGSGDFPWAVEGMVDEGAQPNIFYLNGIEGGFFQIGSIESLVQEFGTVPLDRRIPQQVLIELPYKLTAGAAMKKNFFGNYNGLAPINVFAKYIVRVDVAIVTGWTPQLDWLDSNNNGVLDQGEFAFIDKNQNNKWDLGVDEAVQGTPPAPLPPDCKETSRFSKTETIGDPSTGTTETTATTVIITCSDGSSKTEIYRETVSKPPSSVTVGCPPLCTTTIQPPGDIFFPSCNFLDLECRLNNWRLFPFDLGTSFALLLPLIAIVAIVLIGVTVLGTVRGRRGR